MADAVRSRLLAWYRKARRDLPWRREVSPYRTWVSEIMLQQTRVEAVLAPYARFLERFPDLEALAIAEVDEVLALWSGLGYYRRARLLHQGARHVWGELGGELPRDRRALEKVPGIGRYTAGAILSIAHGLPEPLVDGNVERVLTRLHALGGDPRKAPLKGHLWELATALVPGEAPGDLNQALMELGATVCTPRAPRCETCPVAAACRAREGGEPTRFPQLAPRRPSVAVRLAAALVARGGGWLLLRRGPDESLMPGLWELPTVEVGPDEDPAPALRARIHAHTGLRVRIGAERTRVRHGILDRRITLAAHGAELRGEPEAASGPGWAFVAPEDVGRLGVSSMVTKVLGRVGAPGGSGPVSAPRTPAGRPRRR